jgi:protein-S-isoprenylcysteine O-methyltransferase Ste14
MLLLHLFATGPRLIEFPHNLLGLVPLLAGLVVILWADQLFKRYQTTVKPFRESTRMVTEGPFRISRHPMYLGMLLVLIGVWLLFGTTTPLLIIPIFFLLMTVLFVIPEERDMERQFADQYDEYKRHVRRWI